MGNLLDTVTIEAGAQRFWGALLTPAGELLSYGDRAFGDRSIYSAQLTDLQAGPRWISGAPQEMAVFDEWSAFGATVIDESGNVIVAGWADNGRNSDFRLLKWSPAGEQQWAASYNGAGDYIDQIAAIAAGPEGSVYVTGSSSAGNSPGCTTMRYSAAGEVMWQQNYSGPGSEYCDGLGIAVGPDGNVTVVAEAHNSSRLLVVSNYASDGTILWELIDVTGSQSLMNVLVDDLGRRYVIGWGSGFAGIRIYDSNGLPIGSNSSNGRIFEAVLHPEGGLVVVGDRQDTSFSQCFVRRISTSGETLWEQSYGSVPDLYCSARTVVARSDGKIYVASHQQHFPGHTAVVTHLSASGDLLWNVQFSHDRLTPQQLVLGPAGDPVLLANVVESPSADPSLQVVELDHLTGEEHWRFDSPVELGPMTATDITIGPDGLPVVTANGVKDGRDPRVLAIKLMVKLFANGFE
ncbi:MAG: PQQ-binding-like beta-propeller repeat protein [Xanthomonadales bacterium]|nr:PQQ-binding-like beta-propeller repeat protein [Xanthomonadales bacterium]